jgi:hypothetical protein
MLEADVGPLDAKPFAMAHPRCVIQLQIDFLFKTVLHNIQSRIKYTKKTRIAACIFIVLNKGLG